jgi:hypothetical protein
MDAAKVFEFDNIVSIQPSVTVPDEFSFSVQTAQAPLSTPRPTLH